MIFELTFLAEKYRSDSIGTALCILAGECALRPEDRSAIRIELMMDRLREAIKENQDYKQFCLENGWDR